MRQKLLFLLFSISIFATAQRTIHLRDLTPDEFQERIKSCDFTVCDSLIIDGVVSYMDFERFDAPNVQYLNLKGLLFSDIYPLIMAHDVMLHPILRSNVQQRLSYRFMRHQKLEEVILPDSLKIVGRLSFVDCKNLRKVVLPQGLLVIADAAFRLCHNLEDVAIPESVIAIGGGAFTDTKIWNKKKVVQLPPNLEVIESTIHTGGDATRIEIAKENQFYSSVNGLLFDKSHKRLIRAAPRVKRLKIPSTTEVLDENAFSDMDIREITVPDQVTCIKNASFAFCPKLQSVSLPNHNSLSLEHRLFANSDKLRTIECRSSIPYKNGKKALDGLSKSCIIVVPQGAKTAYEQAEGWQDYRIEEKKR